MYQSEPSDGNGGSTARSRRGFVKVVQWFPAALLVIGTAVLVARERSAFVDAVGLITASAWPWWLGALLLVFAGRGVLAGTSIVIVSHQITGLDAATTAFAWMRSATARYVPGGVWHGLALVERLRRVGVPAPSAAAVYYVDTVGTIVAAAIIGSVAVPALVSAEAGTSLWLLLILPAAISLHPRVFAFALRVLGRITGRNFDNIPLSWRTIAAVISFQSAGWLLVGCAIKLILEALGESASWPLVFAATSLSWAAGLVVVPAPAGLGIREAALVALLVSQVPVEAAVAAALVSRVLFVLLDVVCFLVSFVGSRVVNSFGSTNTAHRLDHVGEQTLDPE